MVRFLSTVVLEFNDQRPESVDFDEDAREGARKAARGQRVKKVRRWDSLKLPK